MTTTGDPNDFVETFEFYDADNPAAGEYAGLLKRHVDFEGRATLYTYDSFGRAAAQTHSATGLPTRTVDYTYHALGQVVEVDDSEHGVTAYQYDGDRNLEVLSTPEGAITYQYHDVGHLLSIETLSTRTEYGYDGLGRLDVVRLVKRDGVALATAETVTYHYDAADQLDYQVNDATGITTDYVLDDVGQVVQLTHFHDTDQDGEVDVGEQVVAAFDYTYDAPGRRTQAIEQFDTDNNGSLHKAQRFTWIYDGANRLVEERFDDGDDGASANDYVALYAFDLASNRVTLTKDHGNDGSQTFRARSKIT